MTATTKGGCAVGVQVRVDIDAPAERVYDLVADLPGMGRWSPENSGGSWLGDATEAGVGARFRGRNHRGPLRWSTTCTVTEAQRGKAIEWTVGFAGIPIARWRYDFEPTSSGTSVTESFEDRRPAAMKVASVPAMGIRDRDKHNRTGMVETLQRLPAAAETG
ncbi:MAG: hypothetical protein QOG53_1242 [Frankiales bacterium]|jgi:uncharacterized protein YndB with AHSA1/START domain|nr:hypothetical protein [Frankiales bacterium]